MNNAANAKRVALTRAGKRELAKERLTEAHNKYVALRWRINDSPMPEGIMGARRMRRKLTRAILNEKDTVVLQAKEIALSEIEAEVEKRKEGAVRETEEEMSRIKTAKETLPAGPGATGILYGGAGSVLGFVGGVVFGMVSKIMTGLGEPSTITVTGGMGVAVGIVLGAVLGIAVGLDNRKKAFKLAEADHEMRSRRIYYESWVNPLVKLGRKAQELVESCKKLISE